ncbi:zinc finger MYM-type protein 4 [Platysternon megacephalum]|uniref:Zinc finger MYM-type protein 4 n=1 Tax=Platysternon megacephalum TaxID=55544 RepID=A0A4D9F7A0_9SAUR|nr:zinc finger MYM-type protein 4 [Platysternon megacephalum]
MHTLNDQLSHFIVNKSKMLDEDKDAFLPSEKESLKNSMMLMRHLLMDAQDTQNLYGVGDAGTPSYASPFIPVHHILSSD